MPDIDKFDAAFFNLSPKEAELMDPQQRLFLTAVWQAIEDAGYKAQQLSGSKTGLFVGVASSDYAELLSRYGENNAWVSTGNAHSILANRVSYLLNIHGPSEPIDTACSSSLVAIHRAVESIRSHKCDMAIAGGVNAILTPTLNISFSHAGMLSPEGRCKTFDQSANGYVRGEGVGAIILKPLHMAKDDQDHIYAVIKGSAENHGGNAQSLTAPNPTAQKQLILAAYEDAQIDPTTVTYIEAHGTATSLGDPIEIDALKNAFSALYYMKNRDNLFLKHLFVVLAQ
jgi:polyketide synthase PksN